MLRTLATLVMLAFLLVSAFLFGQDAQFYSTNDNDVYMFRYGQETAYEQFIMRGAALYRCYPGQLEEDFSCSSPEDAGWEDR